tara:strand:- start:353 stop:679 length:327 start_codon:yes stop_codon:yes gene_type:complete
MTENQMPQPTQNCTMLVLNIAPELEEDLIDYLLSFEDLEGFTSVHVHGHGDHISLTVAEQVTGRRKRAQYQLLLDDSIIPKVLAGLAESVGKDIVYWEQAIRNFGHVT